MEYVSDGRQCHFITTEDFQKIVEVVSGKDLGWFFEVYLRQPELPELMTSRKGNKLSLKWDVPKGLKFNMPVEIRLGSEIRKIEMKNGWQKVVIPNGVSPGIDPNNWILKQELPETTGKLN
jgi:aminopeptidase N